MNTNDNQTVPAPIQLLIVACPKLEQPNTEYAWLHGYALLTLQPGMDGVAFDGEVAVGDRYAENPGLVDRLTASLDPTAVLAGIDLHDAISRLGRLPLGADDPASAIALLKRLREMLAERPPVDLSIDDRWRALLATRVTDQGSELAQPFEDATQAIPIEGRVWSDPGSDNANPHRLAAILADRASAAVTAIAARLFTPEQQDQVEAAWQNWRRELKPTHIASQSEDD